MTLSKSQKFWLGLGTFLPAAYGILAAILFFGFIMTAVATESMGNDPDMIAENILGAYSVAGVAFWIISSIIFSIVSLVVLIIYIIHAVKKENISSSERVMWILLFIFIGLIGQVIYFFMHVMNSNNKEKPNQEASQGQLSTAG
jgi:hypothetical protein